MKIKNTIFLLAASALAIVLVGGIMAAARVENGLAPWAGEAAQPDLVIIKEVYKDDLLYKGDQITYTLTYSNAGANTAPSTTITDVIPSEITSLSYTSSRQITPTGSTSYTWDLGDLLVDDGGTITITGIISPYASGSIVITNTAYITSTKLDFDSLDNTFTITSSIFSGDPVTGLVASNDSPTQLGDTTTLTATVSGGTQLSYAWDFGDTTSGSGAVTQHLYPSIGVFTATVTATNPINSLTTTTPVTVTDQLINGLTATNDSPNEISYTTTLTASISAGTNVSYTWEFGDGQYSTGAVVGHIYPWTGVYTAVVTATNPVNTVTDSTVVIINDQPVSGLSASNDSPTEWEETTTLTATIGSGTNVSYAWTFGDGEYGTGAVADHVYLSVGVYTAWVTATNSINSLSASTVITINPYCLAKINNETTTYTHVQDAVNASSIITDVVKVSGICDQVIDIGGAKQVVKLDRPLTLQGGWNKDFSLWDPDTYPTILDAQEQGRVMWIHSPFASTAVVEHLILQNGLVSSAGGGGIYTSFSIRPIIRNCEIRNNTGSKGGGIYISSDHVKLENNLIHHNQGGYSSGGGLEVSQFRSYLTMTNNMVYNNQSSNSDGTLISGAGIKIYEHSSPFLEDNQVYDNESVGIIVQQSDNAVLDGNIVHHNPDGGILASGDNGLIIRANQTYSNTGEFGGYGISISTCPAAVISGNSTFNQTTSSPYATRGISISDSNGAQISGNQIYGNSGTSFGAGLHIWDSINVQVYDNQITQNSATMKGGGLYAYGSHGLSINSNSFLGNTADQGAAIITYESKDIHFINNIVTGNISPAQGAVFFYTSSEADLIHNTIASNPSSTYGVTVAGASVSMTNNIIADHYMGIQVNQGSTATITSTLFGTGDWANTYDYNYITDTLDVPGNLNIWGDPAFQNPAAGNYHITNASDALDAGVNAGVTIDFDGETRPIGAGFDIGADEFNLFTPLAGLQAQNDGPTALGHATQLSASVAQGTNPIYYWDFGDGTNGSGAVVSHVYPQPGIYEAQVNASNPVNSLSKKTIVNIYEALNLPPGSTTTTTDGLLNIVSDPICTGTFTITYSLPAAPAYGMGDLLFADVVFHLDAVDSNGDPVTSFSPPMTLTVNYDESELPVGIDEATLQVFRYDVGIPKWVALPVINRDLAGDKITVVMDHFSEFILAVSTGIKNPIFIPLILR